MSELVTRHPGAHTGAASSQDARPAADAAAGGPITVYTTEPCSYCRAVKALLSSHGLPYAEVNLAKDVDGRAELSRRTGMLTFPQVLVGERLIGGFEETRALLASRAQALAGAASAGSAGTGTCPAPPQPS